MKTYLIAVALIFSNLCLAQAPGVGNAVAEFQEALHSKLDETREKMILQIAKRELDFSDYNIASKELLIRIENAEKAFTAKLTDIEDFLSLYDTIQNSQSNRAMERLYEQKQKELVNYQDSYKAAAANFITLADHLNLILQKEIGHVNFTGEGWVKIATSDVQYIMESYSYRASMDVRYSYKGYWGKREELKGNLQGLLNKNLRNTAEDIFKNCQTQGCVYYLAEDVSLWLQESQKTLEELNIPVKGVKAFAGPEFAEKYKVIQKVIDEMADQIAATLPTTL